MSLSVREAEPTAAHLVAARELLAEAEANDGSSPVSDQAMLAAAQGQRALLFAEGDSTVGPIALAIVGQGEVDLVVRPAERGNGVGSSMLAAALDHLQARSGELRAWAHGDNPAADALLGSAGFTPVRALLRMDLDPALLPQDARDPLATPVPSGLTLRAFDPGNPADATAWVRANAASFADHPEQGRITEADFTLMREEGWFDPDDLILLVDADGAVVASTWIKTIPSGDNVEGSRECELYALGVRPEYAGQGLGRLLLDVTLARMAQHRPTQVSLYVDGENQRAVELYERALFTVGSSSRQWLRAAGPADSARMDA